MLIQIKNLSHTYGQGGPYEKQSLKEVNLSIDQGEFLALIGHTGSGKSTLIQHMNGLIKPMSGDVIIDGQSLKDKATKLAQIRRKVGLVFQYPEHQIFEESVYKDIAFAASNQDLDEETTYALVRRSMQMVNLEYETYKDLPPLDLSGGQKRRVAIAGVLVMEPKVLVLDEPTAGLDPAGRDEILGEIADLNKKYGLTVVLVSHSMDEVANFVDRIVVMDKGSIFMDDKAKNIFKRSKDLRSIGLDVPQVTSFMEKFQARGVDVSTDPITIKEAKDEIIAYLRRRDHAD